MTGAQTAGCLFHPWEHLGHRYIAGNEEVVAPAPAVGAADAASGDKTKPAGEEIEASARVLYLIVVKSQINQPTSSYSPHSAPGS